VCLSDKAPLVAAHVRFMRAVEGISRHVARALYDAAQALVREILGERASECITFKRELLGLLADARQALLRGTQRSRARS
jgi:hypothetical protein